MFLVITIDLNQSSCNKMKKILLNGEDRSYDVENLIELINLFSWTQKNRSWRKTAKLSRRTNLQKLN